MLLDLAFGHWLAGLTDGEGCFSINRVKQNNFAMQFSIKLRDDDFATLQACRDTLDIGRLYRCPASHTPFHAARPQGCWRVYTKSDTRKLVDVFDTFPLRSKKQRDFQIWRRAVLAHHSMTHGTRWTGVGDWSVIEQLKDELESTRAYPGE